MGLRRFGSHVKDIVKHPFHHHRPKRKRAPVSSEPRPPRDSAATNGIHIPPLSLGPNGPQRPHPTPTPIGHTTSPGPEVMVAAPPDTFNLNVPMHHSRTPTPTYESLIPEGYCTPPASDSGDDETPRPPDGMISQMVREDMAFQAPVLPGDSARPPKVPNATRRDSGPIPHSGSASKLAANGSPLSSVPMSPAHATSSTTPDSGPIPHSGSASKLATNGSHLSSVPMSPAHATSSTTPDSGPMPHSSSNSSARKLAANGSHLSPFPAGPIHSTSSTTQGLSTISWTGDSKIAPSRPPTLLGHQTYHNFAPDRSQVLVKGILRLSDYAWYCISDFLQSPILGHVCYHLRLVLSGRHVVCRVTSSNLFALVANLQSDPDVRSLIVNCHSRTGMAGAQALSSLKHAPSLYHLALRLGNTQLTDGGVQALMPLRSTPALRSLDLNLCGNGITDEGARALASLRDAPIHTLRLDLSRNRIGSHGVAALAVLKWMPSLRDFTLELSDNPVTDYGAQALVSLKGSPSIQSLTLRLQNAVLSDGGACALTSFAESTSLKSLTLDVSNNRLTQTGYKSLRSLRSRKNFKVIY